MSLSAPELDAKPDQDRSGLLWAFLLLLLIPAGGHLGKNALGPLENQVCEALVVGPAGFGLLLSSVSFPSVIFPSVSGVVYDRFSGATVLLAAATAVLVGQALLLSSYESHTFGLAMLATVVFGAGCGSLNSLQHATMASTLGQQWLGLCLGICVCVTNMWRMLANLALPGLHARFGLTGPCLAIIAVCVMSLAAGCLLNRHNRRKASADTLNYVVLKSHKIGAWSPRGHQPFEVPSSSPDYVPIKQPVRNMVWDPRTHSFEVWSLWVLHTCLMASTIGFSNIAPSYLLSRSDLNLTSISANTLLATSWRPATLLGAACGGCIADRVGRGRTAVVYGLGLLAAFMVLASPAAWPFVRPAVPLAVLGLVSGALTTTTLAWLPSVLHKSQSTGTGTAYGVMQSFAALGEVFGNILIGAATARWGLIEGAMPVILAIAGCCCGLIFVLVHRCPDERWFPPRRTTEPLLAVV